MPDRTCRGCGDPLPPLKGKGNPRVWCSERCRVDAWGRLNPDKLAAQSARAVERRCKSHEPIRHESTCVVCGITFSKRQRAKYCSPKCKQFATFLSVVERGVRDDPDVKARRAEWAKVNRYRYREKQRLAEAARYAANPEATLARARRSAALRWEHLAPERRRKKKHKAAQVRLDRAVRGTTGGRVVWAYGRCHHCGETFTGKMTYSVQVPAFCSKRCSQSATMFRRRAQEAGARITKGRRYKVFERDGWRCQICGDPVDRLAKVPTLDAPTIDHRIPLAAGGAHEESNWQTAHFYCNSVKRDQIDFDFAA